MRGTAPTCAMAKVSVLWSKRPWETLEGDWILWCWREFACCLTALTVYQGVQGCLYAGHCKNLATPGLGSNCCRHPELLE